MLPSSSSVNTLETAMNFAQAQIPGSQQEIALLKTHGRGAVTATAALVKDQLAVLLPELIDHRPGPGGN